MQIIYKKTDFVRNPISKVFYIYFRFKLEAKKLRELYIQICQKVERDDEHTESSTKPKMMMVQKLPRKASER